MSLKPLVSIVIPMYNAEKYIKEAILSITNQTYKNLEIIIIDDCSKDKSVEIVKSIEDDRIILIKNDENLQQPKTRNKGLMLAKGKYIANMDADDISVQDRIEKQVAFMEKHPWIDICGTQIEKFGKRNFIKRLADIIFTVKFPEEHDEIIAEMPVRCVLAHPTAMFRTESVHKYGIRYNPEFRYAQDFELWSRLIFENVKFANLPQKLLRYRMSDEQVGNKHGNEQKKYAIDIIKRNIGEIIPDEDFFFFFNEFYDEEYVKKDIEKLLKIYIACSDKECHKKKQIENFMDVLANSLVNKNIKFLAWYLMKKPNVKVFDGRFIRFAFFCLR